MFLSQEDKLNYALLVSLAEGSVDFVKLFISYGVSLSKLLDRQTLEFLYAYRSKESTLKYQIKTKRFVTITGKKFINLFLIYKIIEDIIRIFALINIMESYSQFINELFSKPFRCSFLI